MEAKGEKRKAPPVIVTWWAMVWSVDCCLIGNDMQTYLGEWVLELGAMYFGIFIGSCSKLPPIAQLSKLAFVELGFGCFAAGKGNLSAVAWIKVAGS